eukprot:scaffold13_cov241-Pinguiococcus_pyrenoidosus.AAC.38
MTRAAPRTARLAAKVRCSKGLLQGADRDHRMAPAARLIEAADHARSVGKHTEKARTMQRRRRTSLPSMSGMVRACRRMVKLRTDAVVMMILRVVASSRSSRPQYSNKD